MKGTLAALVAAVALVGCAERGMNSVSFSVRKSDAYYSFSQQRWYEGKSLETDSKISRGALGDCTLYLPDYSIQDRYCDDIADAIQFSSRDEGYVNIKGAERDKFTAVLRYHVSDLDVKEMREEWKSRFSTDGIEFPQ